MIELSLSTVVTTLFGIVMSAMMSLIISKLKLLDSIEKNNILLNERYRTLGEKIDKLSILEGQVNRIPIVERDLKTAFRQIDELRKQLKGEK
jgi:hypothetical protein